MQISSSGFTYKGVSLLPLLLLIPLFILGFSNHWAYDEALTYVNIVDATPWEIVTYAKFKLANNHFLNSLYYYFLNQAGVKTLFIYRLPSFLAFFAYYWFISRLLTEQQGYKLRHIDQLMLYLWPYSVYFAQARGYGIAMVCMLGALLFLKHYLKDSKPKDLLYFILLGCFSSLFIFSFIFPFAAMIIIVGIRRFSEIIKSPLRILIIALCIPVALYVFDKGQVVSKYDTAIIGRDSLIRGGTLSSLLSFLSLIEFAPQTLFLTFKVMVTVTLLPVLYFIIKRGKLYIELTIIGVTLLLLVFCHYVLGAQYPIYRGVAYLIMLFLLSFAYSNFNKNIFFTIHFLVIIFIGCIYLGIIYYYTCRPGAYDVMAYVAPTKKTILFASSHRAPQAVNIMHHRDSVDAHYYDVDDIINYEKDQLPQFYKAMDTAGFIVCGPERMRLSGKADQFERKYDIASFFMHTDVLYERKRQ